MGYMGESDIYKFPSVEAIDKLMNMLVKLNLREAVVLDFFVLLMYKQAYGKVYQLKVKK